MHNFVKHMLVKPDQGYLDWLFPQSKHVFVNGLVFTFITVTSLSMVDFFYYSKLERLAQGEPLSWLVGRDFGIDSFFRLVVVPLVILGAIHFARSARNNSMKTFEWVAAVVIFTSMLGCLSTGLCNDYYSADDFCYDVLVLILFSQLLYGLPLRSAFIFSLLLVTVVMIYLILDDIVKEFFIYDVTFMMLVWLPVSFGKYRLDKSRQENYRTIKKLEETHQELATQKRLLRAGEKVSKLASWNTSNGSKQVNYSEGIYEIYEFDKTQVTKENLLAQVLNQIHPDDRETVLQQFKKIGSDDPPISNEHRIVLPSGKLKWIRNTVGEYVKGEGLYGTVQDITKEKILGLALLNKAKELEIKNEDLQQFAYASSHDLQEPLRSITNFVQVLNRKLEGQLTTESQLYMDIILSSTGRMSNLITAILDYSRIGRNKKLEHFESNAVLEDVLTDLSFAIQESGGKVLVDELPAISGYRAEFSTLLQNLIGNALKFKKNDVPPLVKVSGTSRKGEYRFSVQDNGIGMEEKHANKIFQLFSRLHSKDQYEGTGIGLTHSKKIVELHGGKIWVESVPGEGTTFHFTISKQLKTKTNEHEVEMHTVN